MASPLTLYGTEGEYMRSRDFSSWIWGDALSLLQQADRLHRQLLRTGPAQAPCWEPPVDMIETESAVLIYVALPGVAAGDVAVRFDPDGISISGVRPLPALRNARIHGLEIPYGRFQRRIRLPLHALEPEAPTLADGCLTLTLKKLREAP
ncbi:Hsp20/alpha crystallin family protein [Bordetella bronchiseptica MBORD678]|nr:Hsp20/alpha crystallin family protein [Bordetella bronchiseptica 00-P-2796]KCV53492.1 Hsp20/alpha crystallin family protein [Bordetella bronchiseptica 7E71]KDB58753.1 Hsp20/alpha crystallin family protein [Bordetella bronchiseptica B18-5 (C3)]KDB66805.1 Hsp20/alpha crystallin family protein [Bordetella bronchiseptica A1-7]KDC00055.1 Hsp20/alpha crystallin family protein [Bordetella bronchiseptica D993]KDC08097.1 Hsp20/alpha crystallin family protein [Bordetella bronchiseptica E012]KDC08479